MLHRFWWNHTNCRFRQKRWDPMRMFNTVLGRPKLIILVLNSHRNVLFIVSNTWSISVYWLWEKMCRNLSIRNACPSSGWDLMTNIFSKFKNMNHQILKALSIIFPHFDTYAFENAQKVISGNHSLLRILTNNSCLH